MGQILQMFFSYIVDLALQLELDDHKEPKWLQ